ncbi:hypothetical protein FHW96_002536 [Novosphingobium sp. SG751A]|nr:hypothetical protein [Novosphingobium sp. SG751A]
MTDLSAIREHMDIVGADDVHLGTVDRVEGNRIKMTLSDSGSHAGRQGASSAQGSGGHHHYISVGLVAAVETDRVRLSANAANAALLEEEEGGEALADSNRTAAADDEADLDSSKLASDRSRGDA